eukprot:9843179-Ditylum_brightwellii.AAC.2
MQESLEKAKMEKAQKTKKAEQSKKAVAVSESPTKMPGNKQLHTSEPRDDINAGQKPPAITKPGKRLAEYVDISSNKQSKK